MSGEEVRRSVGYQEIDFARCCGSCRHMKRRCRHLRCNRFDFAVKATSICRQFDGVDAPYTVDETPLLVKSTDRCGSVATGTTISTTTPIRGVLVATEDSIGSQAYFDAFASLYEKQEVGV